MELEVTVSQLRVQPAAGDEQNVAVVSVAGEVDVASVTQLDQNLVALIAGGNSRIIVDLSAVTFIDSTGLGVIVRALKDVRDAGGWLRVVAQHDRVTKLFAITGLESEVSLSSTVEQAAAK